MAPAVGVNNVKHTEATVTTTVAADSGTTAANAKPVVPSPAAGAHASGLDDQTVALERIAASVEGIQTALETLAALALGNMQPSITTPIAATHSEIVKRVILNFLAKHPI